MRRGVRVRVSHAETKRQLRTLVIVSEMVIQHLDAEYKQHAKTPEEDFARGRRIAEYTNRLELAKDLAKQHLGLSLKNKVRA